LVESIRQSDKPSLSGGASEMAETGAGRPLVRSEECQTAKIVKGYGEAAQTIRRAIWGVFQFENKLD